MKLRMSIAAFTGLACFLLSSCATASQKTPNASLDSQTELSESSQASDEVPIDELVMLNLNVSLACTGFKVALNALETYDQANNWMFDSEHQTLLANLADQATFLAETASYSYEYYHGESPTFGIIEPFGQLYREASRASDQLWEEYEFRSERATQDQFKDQRTSTYWWGLDEWSDLTIECEKYSE